MTASQQAAHASEDNAPLGSLAARGGIGGILMGLANLVPGISGGTMLLAAGVYPQFIQAIAELTTLKFRLRSMVVLGSVLATAFLAVISLAGPVKDLVVHYRWMTYSVFIGLTLGGVPIIWKLIGERRPSVWIAALFGLLGMVGLALVQSQPGGDCDGASGGFTMMFLAGMAGASAMILPGISGGYLLLVMGVYVTILSGIAALKTALKAGDFAALMTPLMEVVIPVGLGVVIGIVTVSNLLKWLLARAEKPTLGALLGLLVGAVVGLWPFQRGVAPAVGTSFKCQPVTAESLAKTKPESYPTEFFDPSMTQIAASIGLIVVGLAITLAVARFGERAKG